MGETVWDVIDAGFFLLSLKDFKDCPGWGTAGSLALDTFSLLPIIPSLGYLTRADDVYDAFKGGNTVIGKVDDLKHIRPGENTLLKHLPDKGNAKANWKQNSGVLRREMKKGKPIRDVSPGNETGFLGAEKNLLRNHGWDTIKVGDDVFWVPPTFK
jgi:hypothetical protein